MPPTTNKDLHIVFDFDGTLIDWAYDTTPLVISFIKECLGEAFTDHHLELLTTTQGFASSVNAFFKTDERIQIIEKIAAIACEQVDNAALIPPNMKKVLERLKLNHKLYIFSARDPHSLKYASDKMGISHLFEVISGFDGKHKPKPDVCGFNAFLRKQNLATDQILYIGDKRSDLTMAHDAGVEFIGAGWLRDTLSESDCDNFCADLRSLSILIGKLGSQKALKFSQQ